jgi:hypothetical protein
MPSTHVGLRWHEAASGKGPTTVDGARGTEKREADGSAGTGRVGDGAGAQGGSTMERDRMERAAEQQRRSK